MQCYGSGGRHRKAPPDCSTGQSSKRYLLHGRAPKATGTRIGISFFKKSPCVISLSPLRNWRSRHPFPKPRHYRTSPSLPISQRTHHYYHNHCARIPYRYHPQAHIRARAQSAISTLPSLHRSLSYLLPPNLPKHLNKANRTEQPCKLPE